MTKRLKKTVFLFCGAICLLLAGGVCWGANFFAHLAFDRTDGIPGCWVPDANDHTPVTEGIHWFRGQARQEWSLTSEDGLLLKAEYLPAAEPSEKTVLLAHGYHGQPEEMGALAKFYRELGYNVLLPYARGHFRSDGAYVGFGWPERRDATGWIRKLIAQNGAKSQIVLHGVSMGGATVMMTSGEDLPPQVKAIIEDCGYTSVPEQLAHVLQQEYGLPAVPLIPLGLLVTKWRTGMDFTAASALQQVAHTRVPVFFIHGAEDGYVPHQMAPRLYAACAGAKKKLWLVPGARHGNSYNVATEAYQTAVREFLRDCGLPEITNSNR